MNSSPRPDAPASSTRSRRDFLKTLGALSAAPYFARAQTVTPRRQSRPNLVFFFTDQQSWDMVGVNGNDQILTPRIDEFFQTATNFRHCVSNHPVCSPYRGMLMTGQHPLYNGVVDNDVQLLTENRTIGEVLRDNGYRTGYIGKWHLYGGPRPRPIPPGPHRHGFETFLSNNCTLDFRPGHAFYYDDDGNKVIFDEWEAYGQTKQALEFLDNQTDDKPFALFVSLHPPHDQGTNWKLREQGRRYMTIPSLMERYQTDQIRLRPNAAIPDPRENCPATNHENEDLYWHWEKLRLDYHGYYAMCSGCDDCFGAVLDALREKGFEDNTVVAYTSDHGDNLHSHGHCWTKSFPEDTSVRVPMLLRHPGRTPEQRHSDLLFGALDIMPTLLGMLGLEIPEACQGQDLSRAIYRGEDDAVESQPLFYMRPAWRGVYTKRYTYAVDEHDGAQRYRKGRDWRVFYDRERDPHQMNNLYFSTHAEDAAVKERLHALHEGWLERFRDPFLPGSELLQRLNIGTGHLSDPGEGILQGRPIDLIHG